MVNKFRVYFYGQNVPDWIETIEPNGMGDFKKGTMKFNCPITFAWRQGKEVTLKGWVPDKLFNKHFSVIKITDCFNAQITGSPTNTTWIANREILEYLTFIGLGIIYILLGEYE